jgi:hypothetical protein
VLSVGGADVSSNRLRRLALVEHQIVERNDGRFVSFQIHWRMCFLAAPCSSVFVAVNAPAGLCQNCVTYAPETLVKSVIYGDTPTRIDVAEVVDSELRGWDSVCVSTRGRNRFPSLLLQPLGHRSVSGINSLPEGGEPCKSKLSRDCDVRPLLTSTIA